MKTVYKPWGKEVWLELNDKYCYKRIYINAGHRTSYQYHTQKLETNYIIDGQAEVWLENDEAIVEKTVMGPGDFFTVVPPRKHRVIAISDIILQEVSTPEVDDVVRLSDDTLRANGRLDYEHMKPALCILTAGKGTRMADVGKNVNKGLLPIDNLAIISHAINKVPSDYEIVIALGHKASQVKEYCTAAHPDRKFIFVYVTNTEGPGSGPGTSLLDCKEHLQRPFYFTTCDCLIKADIPPIGNWLGVHPTSIPEIYSTVKVEGDKAVKFANKEPTGHEYAFTGICAIHEYETFWKELEKNIGDTGEVVSAFYDLNAYTDMFAKTLNWYDIGTIENYIKARADLGGEKLGIPKTSGQIIYRVGNHIIKLFQNPVGPRVSRAKELSTLVPDITYEGTKVLAYEWVAGDTLYNRLERVPDFLNWATDNLWEKEEVDISSFCYEFYKDKTLSRFQQLVQKKNNNDSYLAGCIINGVQYKPVQHYLNNVDWRGLCETPAPTKLFHGDLQFDNVICTDTGDFKLIDWRDTFGSQHVFGDTYYDLAKLYGGICMNYSDMKSTENYSFVKIGADVNYNFKTDESLSALKKDFELWVTTNGFSFDKIKKLVALIYLNMSPLHDDNLDDVLFFHAVTLLHEVYG